MIYPGHVVAYTVSQLGMGVEAKLRCNAPRGANCRVACTACEDADECRQQVHVLTDLEYCNALEWITESGYVTEAYTGPARLAVAGDVVVGWDGESYFWCYPGDEPGAEVKCESVNYALRTACSTTGAVFEVVYRAATGKVIERHRACFTHAIAETEAHHRAGGIASCEMEGPVTEGGGLR